MADPKSRADGDAPGENDRENLQETGARATGQVAEETKQDPAGAHGAHGQTAESQRR